MAATMSRPDDNLVQVHTAPPATKIAHNASQQLIGHAIQEPPLQLRWENLL